MLDLHRLCQDMSRPKSALRREADGLVRDIYAFLQEPPAETAQLLDGWREDFQVIYGGVPLSLNKKAAPEKLLLAFGLEPEIDREEQLRRLLFAVQTYFSLLLKTAMAALLGASEVGPEDVILGTFAERRSVVNYCERDWYCWPLFELENGFRRVMEAIQGQTARYEAPETVPAAARDDVKRLYEALIPRQLRHALGEYYTPDWLAAYTLEQGAAFAGGDIRTMRIADPACGSGTFLLQAIAKKRQTGAGLEEILASVWGSDINPLAVLTAKSNYLLAVLDLLGEGNFALPITRADALELPANAKKADLAVGNPPWVNWEYLPPAYRARSQHLWTRYGLLDGKGIALSFSKTDVSDLITCTAADRLLDSGGTLAFLVRQGVFKSAQNGAGFRRFRLPDGTGLGVLRVDDLSKLKIFEGAASSAAVLFAKKGAETAYPVPYALWRKAQGVKRGPINPHVPPEDAMALFDIEVQQAVPASEDPAAPWLTAPAGELENLRSMLGSNPYRARTGVFTGGANAVYWLTIRSAGNGLVRAANLQGRAKRKTGQVEADLEATHLYPMLKGSNIRRWHTSYDTYILCPHTPETKIRPVPWTQLQRETPKTAAYLSAFRETLDQRRGFAGWERSIQREEFHAILRVGTYTFQPWKVVWRYIGSEFVCAVISSADDPFLGRKLLIPNEKVMYIAADSPEEAYYLCGVLSSASVARCVKGYMNPTSISAHVLGRLRIPRFDLENPIHRELAEACRAGHSSEDVPACLERVNKLAEAL